MLLYGVLKHFSNMKKLIFFSIFFFVILSGFAFYGWVTPDVQPQYIEKIVEKPTDPMDFSLYKLANKERENKMVWNPCLSLNAEERAKQIVNTDNFSHTDYTGKYLGWDFIEKCYKDVQKIGENLTINFSNPSEAHTALMNSPTHKANILGDYTDMGVGCFENVCVEFFAK